MRDDFNFLLKDRQFDHYKKWKCPVHDLLGAVITKIEYMISAGGLRFYCLDGYVYELYCSYDFASYMYMDNIHGSLEWLLDHPILSAGERKEDFLWEDQYQYYYSYTYYSFSTELGKVDLRFIGRDILPEHDDIHPCFIRFPIDYVRKGL